ncbi:hypothetical protein ACFVAV_20665 [Nocardia sp. NPDC057663]|uniref:hypothetical protein n=1 Tax=Nocardia sp. NPDC057663 TaxID=3346201 RepID=UPI0036726D9F
MTTSTPRIDDVVAYLRAHDWVVTGRWRAADVWTRGEFDVLVPADDTLTDAPIRLRELIRCVAEAEGLSPRTIWRDITSPAADTVTYRPADTDGTVVLSDGARAVTALRDLVTYCARDVATGSPGRAPDSGPAQIRSLLRRTRLVPCTESFGFDVALPVDDGDSIGRRTALRILHSSTAAAHAVHACDDERAFARLLGRDLDERTGIALADLAGGAEGSAFELGFRWSRFAPRNDESVSFPPGTGHRIRAGIETAESYELVGAPLPEELLGAVAAAAPRDAVGIVEGPVIGLSDDEHGDRWVIKVRGLLHVDGVAAGRLRPITVHLDNAQDYQAALSAHRNGLRVRAEGVVVTAGRTREMTSTARGFTVLDPPQM